MRSSARAGLTLVEWLVGVVILVMVLALLIPVCVRASRQQKVVACKENLRQLYQAQAAAPKGPAPLGKAFWTRLNAAAFLRCPLVASSDIARCDYLGPGSDPATLGEKDPLGCDAPENHDEDGHQGGNVLLKSGEVHTDTHQLWATAVQSGKCRP